MERLLDFSDIALIPTDKNSGVRECDFYVTDELDNTRSLPIFTAPMDSVVSEQNWKTWAGESIKPILPRTTPLDIRLEGCQYIFAAFSLIEVQDNFLRVKRNSSHQFKICIDPGNGQDTKIFEIGKGLKAMYGAQVNLMGGNMGNPKTYKEYCNSGFDYVRVGITSGSLVSCSVHGFEYPQASLLIDTLGVKNTALVGLKHTKIISDGGISGPVDILKAIALGADYVMVGREFVRLIEAAGPILRREGGKFIPVSLDPNSLSLEEIKTSGLMRNYEGITSLSVQSRRGGHEDIHDWFGIPGVKQNICDSRVDQVKISGTLKNWLQTMYQCFTYGFTMCNANNWETFKGNVRYGRVGS